MSDIKHRDDDYLPCNQYDHAPGDDGFARFEKDGKWYFSFIEKGQVILRSEGYSHEAGRDNGIESVKKNMGDDANYKTLMLPNGQWVLCLLAANHQEIARSCTVDIESEAMAHLPSKRAARLAASTMQESDREEDDYMLCREYTERMINTHPVYKDFIAFQHETTQKFYFAWVSDDHEVILRSEGYPTSGARDKGLDSVRNNRDNEDRYKIEQRRGAWYLVLRAGNNQEIGRSCPKASESEARAWLPSARAKIKAAMTASGGAASAQDDYLVCHEYEEHMSSRHPEHKDFIIFKHDHTDKYYFAWVSDDNKIILRGEGYPTIAARDKGLESVRKNRDQKDRWKTVEAHGAWFLTLRAGNNQEIGRSCPQKSEAGLWALLAPFAAWGIIPAAFAAPVLTTSVPKPVATPPPPQAAPVAPHSPAPAVSGGGFNWWWLLIPLLLLGIFMLWRACNKPTAGALEQPQTTMPEPAPTPTPTPTPEPEAEPEKVVTPSCDLYWILFDYDKAEIRPEAATTLLLMADILKQNPDYRGEIRAYTDSKGTLEYNGALSQRRAQAAKNNLMQNGVNADQIILSGNAYNDPVATNTDDDSGRRFNRRVELYVRDSSGKEICKSVPPAIPDNLKTK